MIARMFSRFRQRSYEPEIIDKGEYTPEEYAVCQTELKRINHYLGDASALRGSLLSEIERRKEETFSVIDVGAGSGELLKVISTWAREKRKRAWLVGVELNERAAKSITEEIGFDNIFSVRTNALSLPFEDDSFDYAICSLFTHHLTDEQVIDVLGELARVARNKIFVIDLHRHAVAYYLYTTIGRLFLKSRLTRHDGALSILKSFRPDELKAFAEKAKLVEIDVKRHFPFRLVLTGKGNGKLD